jgi:carotenoid cleavage dioxygenase-like enzyme
LEHVYGQRRWQGNVKRCSVDLESGVGAQATAHPKIDHRTGEMLSFGYSLDKEPYLTVTTVDPKGAFVREVSVTIRRPVMMHDCAITEVPSLRNCQLPMV